MYFDGATGQWTLKPSGDAGARWWSSPDNADRGVPWTADDYFGTQWESNTATGLDDADQVGLPAPRVRFKVNLQSRGVTHIKPEDAAMLMYLIGTESVHDREVLRRVVRVTGLPCVNNSVL